MHRPLVHRAFFDSDHRLRNGWWMLVFVLFVFLTRFVYTPTSRGLRALGVPEAGLEPLGLVFLLAATWACTALRGESLASVGLRLGRTWLRQLGQGTLIGTVQMLAIGGLILAIGGVRFGLDPDRAVSTLAVALTVFFFAALFEEVLFRGFLFQRMVAGAGVWITQLTFAFLFAAGHWGNPGMSGATAAWASLDIGLGAVIYGLAYLRTGSLALPVGLHFGWNLTQGAVLGFGVSGLAQAGWLRPVLLDRAEWLTGGAFGPEASVFAVVVDLVLLVALWRWRGTVAPENEGLAAPPVPAEPEAAAVAVS